MSTVLVVDDEADIRELLRINLEFDGHEVLFASDGNEAMAIVADRRPDCVVLDVMMPGKDGWQVLTEMKSSADGDVASTPVIMLTARVDDLDRIRGSIEGAIRYLKKPFSADELRREVREALTGEPEPAKRRRVQQGALEEFARIEGGRPSPDVRAPRPHLTRLERPPAPDRTGPTTFSADQMATLSDKQRQLLHAVATTVTVSEAASVLSVSRSNVYASLRRIARKLGERDVRALILAARSGAVPLAD